MHLQDTVFTVVVKWLKYCQRGANTKQQRNQRFPTFECVVGNDGGGWIYGPLLYMKYGLYSLYHCFYRRQMGEILPTKR